MSSHEDTFLAHRPALGPLWVLLPTIACSFTPQSPSKPPSNSDADTPSPTELSLAVSRILGPAESPFSLFGSSISSAGDLDADGYEDLAVGAMHWHSTTDRYIRGRVYVYRGGTTGPSDDPWWFTTLYIPARATLGSSVLKVGDTNGDGYDDLLVAAEAWSGGGIGNASTEGGVMLFAGGEQMNDTPIWLVHPTDQQAAYFGSSVAAGDIDGDGFTDIIVGAKAFDGEIRDEGRVYLFAGGADGISTEPSWVLDPTDQMGAFFGYSVVSGRDLNGDGFDDLAVGALTFNAEEQSEGRVFIYLGGVNGLGDVANITVDPTDSYGAFFGWSLAMLDVNGDGYNDVLVGARNWDGDAAHEGRAYLFFGNSEGVETDPAWFADPTDQEQGYFGTTVAGVGDLNGDGYDEAVIGATFWSGEAQLEGRAYLYLGESGGLSATPALVLDPTDVISSRFGSAIAGPLDLDGNGTPELAIGAEKWHDGSIEAEGRVYLYRVE